MPNKIAILNNLWLNFIFLDKISDQIEIEKKSLEQKEGVQFEKVRARAF